MLLGVIMGLALSLGTAQIAALEQSSEANSKTAADISCARSAQQG